MKKLHVHLLAAEKAVLFVLKSCVLMSLLLSVYLSSLSGVTAYEFKESIGKDWTMNSTTELGRWFNETWIEKVGGTWDVKKKRYSVPGYINGWEMFHFHHVCIRGGSDGFYTGYMGEDNDWSARQKIITKNKKNRVMTPGEWQKYSRVRGLTPLYFHRLQYKQAVNITMRHGSTLFMNCFHQHIKASNPAHWMMKLGVWYETALCQSRNNKVNIFANEIKMPYNHVQMAQCSNPIIANWRWGENMWNIIKYRSDLAGMTDGNTRYDTIGYKLLSEVTPNKLECFEDLYFSARMGLWMQGRGNLVEFRKDTVQVAKEPQDAIINPENTTIVHGFDLSDMRIHHNSYCDADNKASLANGTLNITSARIKVFQRTATVMLRKFTNLDDVVKLAQTYTTVPVEVITINETSPIQEQIKLFNSFDVLITSHGSHLANGLFTTHPQTKAVVEIVAFVFDSVFYGNFNHWLGFSDYIVSSGHLTPGAPSNGRSFYFGDLCPFQKKEDFASHNCTDVNLSPTDSKYTQYPKKLPQTWKICHEHWQTRACDTLVDLDILKTHLDTLFKEKLCRPGPEDPRELPSDMKLAGGVLDGFQGFGQGSGAIVNKSSVAASRPGGSGSSAVNPPSAPVPAVHSTAPPAEEEQPPNPEDFHRRKLRLRSLKMPMDETPPIALR